MKTNDNIPEGLKTFCHTVWIFMGIVVSLYLFIVLYEQLPLGLFNGWLYDFLGMILGIGLTEGVNTLMEMANVGKEVSRDDMSIFLNPTVNLSIALSATALIVVAGVLAGYFPARKAVQITAIEAMRNEA